MIKDNLNVSNSNFNLGYILFEPKELVTEKMPLLVFLHGAGERGNGTDQLDRVKKHGIPQYISNGAEYPAYVLCPQCPENMIWNNIVFSLKSLIDNIVEQYNIDTDRICITGISMGGYGTWEMGILYPDYFSAIAPICGGGVQWRAHLLKDTPVRAFHGDKDPTVSIENTYLMVDAINKVGGKAEFIVLHNVDHNSWDYAYLQTNLIDWLISNHK